MMDARMGATSAGLLVYRIAAGGAVEVLIAHPGGPFWARKGDGSWTVPKGEYDENEDPLAAAFREFAEETGLELPHRTALLLGELRQPGGKRVMVWALNTDLDVTQASSNTFRLEWPKGSGHVREFPEVDRLEWVTVGLARKRLLKGQVGFLDRLLEAVGVGCGTEGTAAPPVG
jgi:predicted NUDIX family NTP pyrophosphohydrolase